MTEKQPANHDLATYSEPVRRSDGYGPKTDKLFQFLAGRVIGQERAVRRIANGFALHHAGIRDMRRPIHVAIFSGPTGVGKTMMAGEVGKYLIADQLRPPISTIDCQMFSQDHQLSQLIGSPPGYVGYKEPPLLSQLKIDGPHFWVKYAEYIKANPNLKVPEDRTQYTAFMTQMYKQLQPYNSVILFDEVEKAHPRVHKALLGIIDKGEAIMADGKRSDFTQSVIILTCNIGGRHASDMLAGRSKQIGLQPAVSGSQSAEAIDQAIYQDTLDMIQKFFPPEFIGRLRDQIVVFRSLSRESCATVLDNMLAEVQQRVNAMPPDLEGAPEPPPITLAFTPEFKEMVLDQGVSREWGLRKLEQAVKQRVVLELANAMECQEVRPGDEVLFAVKNGQVALYRKPRARKQVTVSPTNGDSDDLEKLLDSLDFSPPDDKDDS
jgi:ATP-dependent Clp protease ATP-binding subunit ClpA